MRILIRASFPDIVFNFVPSDLLGTRNIAIHSNVLDAPSVRQRVHVVHTEDPFVNRTVRGRAGDATRSSRDGTLRVDVVGRIARAGGSGAGS